MLAVALTRRKETRPRTIAAMRRRVLAAGTRRLLVPILRRAAPILPRAAVTAAAVHLMLVAGEVHPTVVEAAEVPMAVAVVLTAIVKIGRISIFQKGPSLLNAAGLLFC
jgi:hypothetical protein